MGKGNQGTMRRAQSGLFGSGDLYLLQRLASQPTDAAKRNHDVMNLCTLPFLAVASTFGSAGMPLVPHLWLSWIFMAYIVFDFAWICLQPQCVPKKNLVLVHHVITMLLLSHPIRFPENGVFTCYDGMVEINTVILTLKRTVRFESKLMKAIMKAAHWSTFIALRMVAYPIFTYIFWTSLDRPDRYSLFEFRLALWSQFGLLGFNCLFLHLMLTQRRASKPPGENGSTVMPAMARKAKAKRAD